MKNKIFSQLKGLTMILGGAGLTGPVAIAALNGMFKPENALMLAVLFMAGPGAIISALLLEGTLRERLITAVLAGGIATLIVALAATAGSMALSFLNLNVLKVAGGIAVFSIGLMIIGVKIPDKIPLAIFGIGVIAGLIWRGQ